MRDTRNRWHGALLGGTPGDHVPCLGIFRHTTVTDVKVSPSVQSICSLSHMCDWQGYAHPISWCTCLNFLTCKCVTHTFSHTQLKAFQKAGEVLRIHISATTVWVFGEIPRKISSHRCNAEGVRGRGHLWVLWSLYVIRSVGGEEAFGVCDVWFAWAVNHLCLHPDNQRGASSFHYNSGLKALK